MKLLRFLLVFIATPAFAGTVTGAFLSPNGVAIKNATVTFTLQQAGLAIGSGSVVPTSAQCYTSTDGSVVGLPNPLTLPTTSISYGSGTLPAATYYVEYAWYVNSTATLPSPELKIQLTSAGTLIVQPPASGVPTGATGMLVYIGTTSGGELAQGQTTGTAQYAQTGPLNTGAAPVTANNTVCTIAFNDTIIPYTGYNVSLVSASGNSYPGFPQAWQLNGGLYGTVNISAGSPFWNGVTVYPQPIVAQPLNHGPQSIAGLLNMTGYNIVNVGQVGVGTSTPSYSLDVENGFINTSNGYLYQGGSGTFGNCLVSNGTAFIPGSCGTTPTLYYQHVQANGTLLPQEPFLNFTQRFAPVDNSGSTRTDVDLAASGVTAASYTNPNITVDTYGRVTAATNGTSIPAILPIVITSGICTTPNTAYATCNFTYTIASSPFADGNYSVVCGTGANPSGTSAALTGIFASNETATSFELTLQNGTSGGAGAVTVSRINCMAMHP